MVEEDRRLESLAESARGGRCWLARLLGKLGGVVGGPVHVRPPIQGKRPRVVFFLTIVNEATASPLLTYAKTH
jgi:hypothetical protein